jgi:sugar/nucleoside kinase (ribokinase family)
MSLDALVFGNVTLDVICYPVNEVPRTESIAFDDVMVSPGGCGSNTAIGLAALGVPTGIVGRTGDDDAADLLFRYWTPASCGVIRDAGPGPVSGWWTRISSRVSYTPLVPTSA